MCVIQLNGYLHNTINITVNWNISNKLSTSDNSRTLHPSYWLTELYGVFDHVTADRQTHVWQQQLNTALQQRAWMHIDMKLPRFIYFIIISMPPCVSIRWQLCQTYCCIAPDSGWLYFTFIAPTATTTIGSVVLSQYTRVTDRETDRRHTASYDYSQTLQCNCNVPLIIIIIMIKSSTWNVHCQHTRWI